MRYIEEGNSRNAFANQSRPLWRYERHFKRIVSPPLYFSSFLSFSLFFPQLLLLPSFVLQFPACCPFCPPSSFRPRNPIADDESRLPSSLSLSLSEEKDEDKVQIKEATRERCGNAGKFFEKGLRA